MVTRSKWPMSKAQEYRTYAAECWRKAWESPKDRDYWMAAAARWMVLAAMMAKTEGQRPPIRPASESED